VKHNRLFIPISAARWGLEISNEDTMKRIRTIWADFWIGILERILGSYK